MKRYVAISPLLAMVLATTGIAPALAETESVAFGVNEFGTGANECGSSTTSDLNYCDDFARVFDDAFEDEGWAQTRYFTNSGVDGRDWTDAGKATSSALGSDTNDPWGVDFADVGMICSHGAHTHASSGNYSGFLMGDDDSNNTCYARTDSHIEVGNDGDLEILMLQTCQSAHYDVWTDGGYFDVRDRNGRFSTWLGFHGNSYDSRTDTNRFEDYLQASFRNGLGENYLDEMYRNPWGANNTQCPTAVIFCEKSADCDSQFEWGGFEDRFKVAVSDVKKISSIYYISGCNPDDGAVLP